ncbi:hypothetical protein [Myxococcus sp. CA039A]|uniref:hypothetical protein n=1 Tax=Myxococcus sp. CA039A TaxID=2741737 RepID=UPI00157B2870|nr:hypothetical protein [Myxococcus sp. CA039A]NTX56636.1 hypothetical protein [Myxococcus sp. CA039A]
MERHTYRVALGVILFPGLCWAEVLDKQLAPWESVPVIATVMMSALCALLVLWRRDGLWRVACALSVLWAFVWLQNDFFSADVGPMLRAELSSPEARAYLVLLLVETLLPFIVTLGGLMRRRLLPRVGLSLSACKPRM